MSRNLKMALFLVLLGCLGTLLRLYETSNFGIGITPDSTNYVAAARSLADSLSYRSTTGEPLSIFPPLYPMLLSVSTLLGLDTFNAARYINATLFGLLTLTCLWILSRQIRSQVITLIGATMVVTALPIALVCSYAWSEPLFILITILYLYFLSAYEKTGSAFYLKVASALIALCLLTRYAGATLLIPGYIAIYSCSKICPSMRTRHAILLTTSLIPALLWAIRTQFISGTTFGNRPSAAATLTQNLSDALATLGSWIVPAWSVPEQWSVVLPLAAALGVSIIFSLNGRKKNVNTDVLSKNCTVFLLTYFTFMVAVSSVISIDGLSDRLMAPVFFPVLIIGLSALDRMNVLSNEHRYLRWSYVIFLMLLSFWTLIYPVRFTVEYLFQRESEGVGGYATPDWRSDKLAQFVLNSDLSGFLYSNDPAALYYLTGRPSKIAPRKTPYHSNTNIIDNELIDLEENFRTHKDIYVLWFNRSNHDYILSLSELMKVLDMHQVYQSKDGSIYRVARLLQIAEPTEAVH